MHVIIVYIQLTKHRIHTPSPVPFSSEIFLLEICVISVDLPVKIITSIRKLLA